MSYKSPTTCFIIVLLCSSGFLPFFANKARAQIPVTDVAHTIITSAESTRKSAKDFLDFGARIVAQIAIQQIINSTVDWANNGFEGNPAYATDPKQYFSNIADGVAGEFILGSDLDFLCSPFRTQIRLALSKQLTERRQFQCTFTGVLGNLDGFYGDFNQGGWDAWFSMTQNSANNPYGAYLEAKIELDSRVAEAVGLQDKQLGWNSGFISWSECIKSDPDTGECYERGPVKTPGSLLKSGLDKVLPSGLDRLINVQQADQLIDAFAAGILQRYVFGNDGLFSSSGGAVPGLGPVTNYPAYPTPTNNAPGSGGGGNSNGVDVDGDGVNDIIVIPADPSCAFTGSCEDTYLCTIGGTYPNCALSGG